MHARERELHLRRRSGSRVGHRDALIRMEPRAQQEPERVCSVELDVVELGYDVTRLEPCGVCRSCFVDGHDLASLRQTPDCGSLLAEIGRRRSKR